MTFPSLSNVNDQAKELLNFGWTLPMPQTVPPAGMDKDVAGNVARNLLTGARAWEWPRLVKINDACKPNRLWNELGIEVPVDAPDSMKRLAMKSQANFLPLVIETFSQVMKVEDYISSDSNETAKGWDYWQRNQMDARQTGIHHSALKYGAGYVICLPGANGNGPVMKGVSPMHMTAVYEDPVNDQWPVFALHSDRRVLYLYDSVAVYKFGMPNIPTSTFGYPAWQNLSDLQFIDSRVHGAGVCPVVRFRDRMLLEGEESFGIVEPLLSVQARINETNFQMSATGYSAAFKQRYVTGWIPQTELEMLRTSASELWAFKDPDVKVGQFDETSADYYVKTKADVLQDLSSLAQIPAQNLGVGAIANISAEALTALEEGKTRKVDEITTSFGESWEQALRLCSHLDGDEDGASDFASSVKWKDATARSFAATIDALGKVGQMLGVPDEILWESIPGWDHDKVERAKAIRAAADPLEALYLQSAQGAPAVGRGIQAEQAADPNGQSGQ